MSYRDFFDQDISRQAIFFMIMLWLWVGMALCFYIYALLRSDRPFKLYFTVVPMASLVLLPMFYNILRSNSIIVNDDFLFQMDIINRLMDKKLFVNDPVLNFIVKNYTVGYTYLGASLAAVFDISVVLLPKVYSIIGAFLMPLLFFFISYAIFKDRESAFFAGLFSFTIPWVFSFIMSGLPRLFGLVFFLLGISMFFYYVQTNRRKYILILSVISALFFHIHYSFFYFIICITAMWGWRVIKQVKKADFKKELVNIFLFCVIVCVSAIPRALHLERVSYASWSYYYKNIGQDTMRVVALQFPPLFHKITKPLSSIFSFEDNMLTDILYSNHSIATELGYFMLFLVVLALAILIYKRPTFDYMQRTLAIGIMSLIFVMITGFYVDCFSFFQPVRMFHFIALLVYVYGVFLTRSFYRHCVKYRIITFVAILLLMVQPLFHSLAASKMSAPFKASFIEAAEWLKQNTDPDTPVACSIKMGDILRAYSTRSVTASDNIGGFALSVKEALPLYNEQLKNTRRYDADPFGCAIDLNAPYVIVTNKNRVPKNKEFEEVFGNAEFYIYRRMQK